MAAFEETDLFARLREPADKQAKRSMYEEQFLVELMKVAASADLEKTLQLLEIAKTNSYDLNRVVSGFTALSYCAAKSGNMQVVNALLDHGCVVRDAHMCAILGNNLPLAEKLLNIIAKDENRDEREPFSESIRFQDDMTPLMLAAILGIRDCIEMLQLRGHSLRFPHPNSCDCDPCKQPRSFEFYRTRFNLFRALANPVYMTMTSENIFETSIKNSLMLKEIIDDGEDPFVEKYEKLNQRLEEHCSQLIQCAHGVDEVRLVMHSDFENLKSNHLDYPLFYAALAAEWKTFLSNSAVQAFRNEFWNPESNKVRDSNPVTTLLGLLSPHSGSVRNTFIWSILLNSLLSSCLLNGNLFTRYATIFWILGYAVHCAKRSLQFSQVKINLRNGINLLDLCVLLSLICIAFGYIWGKGKLDMAVGAILLYFRVLLLGNLRLAGDTLTMDSWFDKILSVLSVVGLIIPMLAFADIFIMQRGTSEVLPSYGSTCINYMMVLIVASVVWIEMKETLQDATTNYYWTYMTMMNYKNSFPVPLNILQIPALMHMMEETQDGQAADTTAFNKVLIKNCIRTLIDRKQSK